MAGQIPISIPPAEKQDWCINRLFYWLWFLIKCTVFPLSVIQSFGWSWKAKLRCEEDDKALIDRTEDFKYKQYPTTVLLQLFCLFRLLLSSWITQGLLWVCCCSDSCFSYPFCDEFASSICNSSFAWIFISRHGCGSRFEEERAVHCVRVFDAITLIGVILLAQAYHERLYGLKMWTCEKLYIPKYIIRSLWSLLRSPYPRKTSKYFLHVDCSVLSWTAGASFPVVNIRNLTQRKVTETFVLKGLRNSMKTSATTI